MVSGPLNLALIQRFLRVEYVVVLSALGRGVALLILIFFEGQIFARTKPCIIVGKAKSRL